MKKIKENVKEDNLNEMVLNTTEKEWEGQGVQGGHVHEV